MVKVRGGGHSSSGGPPAPVAARPTPLFRPAEVPSGPSTARGAAGGGVGGLSLPRGGWGPSFRYCRCPAQTRGEVELRHTCDCPRCMVHYETCIQSLMAQVQDLRAQNLELQRSGQELSQAVVSAAGISQSYGGRMTQILSTFAKFNAVVQSYQRDSKAAAASVSDHLKMFHSKTAKCSNVVETLTTCYAAVASRLEVWDHWYARPAEPGTVVPPPPSAHPAVPDPEPVAPMAPMSAPSGSSGRGCVLPFSVHPSHDESTIQRLVRTRGGPGGGALS